MGKSILVIVLSRWARLGYRNFVICTRGTINFSSACCVGSKRGRVQIVSYYSVSSLETTIFRQIISLVRVNFRRTFLSSWLTPNFYTLMGGNTCPLLPPIRVEKYGVSQELRKVDLKNWLV